MSYTKGPWRVLGDEVRGRPRRLVVDARGDEIAAVNPYREAWNENADLIAAAPDLLEFAKQFEQQIRTTPGFDYQSFAPWLNARDLIKQAEGGE